MTEPTNPYKEFNEAHDRLWWSIFEALHIRQIVEWMTKQLNKIP
jgi:hypothetical protein